MYSLQDKFLFLVGSVAEHIPELPTHFCPILIGKGSNHEGHHVRDLGWGAEEIIEKLKECQELIIVHLPVS